MIQRWDFEYGEWCSSEDVAVLEAEVAALQASLAALREAARPFAELADYCIKYRDTSEVVVSVNMGEVRALARAMEEA